MKIILAIFCLVLGFVMWCCCAAASNADKRAHIPTLYCMVGLPGSGKSHYCKYIGYVVSSNKIHEEKGIEEDSDEMLEEMLKSTLVGLEEKIDVYFDARNLSKKHRKRLIEATAPVHHVCLIMNTPLEKTIEQDARMDHPVGEYAIYDMWNMYEEPTKDEGWDRIYYVE